MGQREENKEEVEEFRAVRLHCGGVFGLYPCDSIQLAIVGHRVYYIYMCGSIDKHTAQNYTIILFIKCLLIYTKYIYIFISIYKLFCINLKQM